MQRSGLPACWLWPRCSGVAIGGFSIAYGSGRGSDDKPLLREDCGTYVRGAEGNGFQVDIDGYAYLAPSPLAFEAGNSVDLHWLQDSDADFMVWDMGRKVKRVDVFPSIDHPPIPQEALECTVYASSDPNPPDATPKWVVGTRTAIFDKGWNNEWIADDFVSQWRFNAQVPVRRRPLGRPRCRARGRRRGDRCRLQPERQTLKLDSSSAESGAGTAARAVPAPLRATAARAPDPRDRAARTRTWNPRSWRSADGGVRTCAMNPRGPASPGTPAEIRAGRYRLVAEASLAPPSPRGACTTRVIECG